MEVFRDRKFCLLLYPEDASHENALEQIKRTMDYAVVLHDKDIMEDGTTKKPHYHVVITVGNNPKWSSALAKELGVEPNYIEKPRNLDRALEYLIHYNDVDKHQYSIDEVTGTLKNRLIANLNSSDKTEGEKIAMLIDIIENEAEKITFAWFSKYCATSGYWDIYRRSAILFTKMIEEHNRALDYVRQRKSELGFVHIEDTREESPFEGDNGGNDDENKTV